VTVPDPDLGLVALVTHARSVPSEAREAFGDAAAVIANDPRAILLRTCHRVELYAAVDVAEGPGALRFPELPVGGRRLDGMVAARHVFSVAAGLDSVVVGEDQILHQLRECLSDRHVPGAERCPVEIGSHAASATGLHPVLERLFQVALHLGRETRSWREGPPRSLADVALDRVEPAGGPFPGRRVLVVGAGRMARLCAIAASRRGARVLVANRSSDRAAALAFDANGEPAAFGPDAPLPEVDALLLAISGRWPLSPGAREALLAGGQPVVDLSSPPALDPAIRAALGARYTSVDDIARSPQDLLRKRVRTRFERALDDAEQNLAGWARSRDRVPAIQALSDHAETRRIEELDRLFRRLALDDKERELVEQMSHRLVAGLLHQPLVVLREDGSGEAERAARTLFSL
jgi:glutamyl-tRNA reductase